jgi:DNA-binding NtrC family response regulator
MEPLVFIVDNDMHTREILQNILLAERYQVICQTSKLDAVSHCVEIKPDVVLLGVAMPKMLELSILDGIRLSSPSVPVVIMSGNATADFAKNVLSRGASEIIVKPFSMARVIDVVKKCIKTRS